MMIRLAKQTDAPAWAELRAALWPEEDVDHHRREVSAALSAPGERITAFVAVDGEARLLGFAEASLRHDYVNGCETSPVAFLEGIYVRPEHRKEDVGRALCAAVEAWARASGCSELASDALLDNVASHAFHAAVGLEETERVVYFRMPLGAA